MLRWKEVRRVAIGVHKTLTTHKNFQVNPKSKLWSVNESNCDVRYGEIILGHSKCWSFHCRSQLKGHCATSMINWKIYFGSRGSTPTSFSIRSQTTTRMMTRTMRIWVTVVSARVKAAVATIVAMKRLQTVIKRPTKATEHQTIRRKMRLDRRQRRKAKRKPTVVKTHSMNTISVRGKIVWT